MARIDLIDVCKTLTARGRAGRRAVVGASAAPEGAPPADGRAAAFSIRNLRLRIPDGQTMVVLGPSGCGKTTLLKLIAGLIPPDSGEVRYDDEDVKDLRPGDRRIGMVFQDYALYPHFTSRKNILSYFVFRKKTPELDALARAKYQRTSELMGVELAYLLDRKPTTLSGGEKQRVALGRCITRDAAVFLVDEPFANLDQALREKYRVNLKTLLKQFNITTVYVTHDHHEALILADRLAIMNRARIEQVGTFEEIYDRPENVFVAGFLNLHVDSPPLSLVDARHLGSGDAQVGVRPEDVDVSREEREGGIRGTVSRELNLPMMNATILTVQTGAEQIHARVPGHERFRAGDSVWLGFRRYHVFDRGSGNRLRTHPEERAR
jgi:multiple sugar transport system ATP-binding protein